MMTINFRKLNSQIHPFKIETKRGYIFIAKIQQKDEFIFSISKVGSKRSLIKLLIGLIQNDGDYKAESSS